MIKVVVADDNKFLLEQIVKSLEKSCEIDIVGIANDGEEELEYITKFFPDVVITDIEMPKKTGIEVIEVVKDFEKIPEFIVITGETNSEIMKKFSVLPIKSIYHKPIDMQQLIKEIELLKDTIEINKINANKNTLPEKKTFLQSIKDFFKNRK